MAQGDVLAFIKNRPGNRLINGDFAIDQEKAGGLYSGSGIYCVDQGMITTGTSAQRVANASTTDNFTHYLQVISNSTANLITQRQEYVANHDMLGKVMTFSILMKQSAYTSGGSSIPKISISYANAVDNYSGTTAVVTNAVMIAMNGALNGSFRRFKYSFTVTTEMANNGFFVQCGDATSGIYTIQYAQAMLNEGGAPAPFELAGISSSKELELCQKHLWRIEGALTAFAVVLEHTATQCYASVHRNMRAQPVITFNTLRTNDGVGIQNINTIALDGWSPTGFTLYMTVTSGLIAGRAAMVQQNGASSFLQANARL